MSWTPGFSSECGPYSTMMDPGPGSDFSIPGKTEELDTFYQPQS